eukprot:TRINITY_DN23725_c0_g1_i4.p1 TRINITY_DN23725_c0_g1~~TRINITY_DN23725_c0_g1_i4.p1  ORF type:complete len:271 (+),score=57.91 TRINITY_DN23725_c0_g1_i4:142-954(+)
MGDVPAKCCSERKEEPVLRQRQIFGQLGALDKPLSKAALSTPMKAIPDVPAGQKASKLYGVAAAEAQAVDDALESRSIPLLVQLLRSSGKLVDLQQENCWPPHPWAVPPRSIPALAAMKLVLYAASDERTCKSIVQAGAVPLLAAMLDVQGKACEDKVHAATVALVLLTSSNVACCLQLGDLPDSVLQLLRLLGSKQAPLGCRAAVSTILVNVTATSLVVASQSGGQLLSRVASGGAAAAGGLRASPRRRDVPGASGAGAHVARLVASRS